jgi:hypothetical protein
MLTVYTSTFCRPDYVELLARALKATLQEPYRFIVFVHPGGVVRHWPGVDEVVWGERSGFNAISEILGMLSGPSVVLHDDLIPVLPWSQDSFPFPDVCRFGGSTLNYHANGFSRPCPMLKAKRVWSVADCPEAWPVELQEAAAAARVESMLGGIFLHIDKGTTTHPSSPLNAEKPALVAAICKHLGCEIPAPLTADELAVHPGRTGGTPLEGPPTLAKKAKNFAASAAKHLAAGMPRATDEQVAARFAICQGCEHFDGRACRKCGCPIVRERQFVSKLSWANEKCPVGKWGSGQSPETA